MLSDTHGALVGKVQRGPLVSDHYLVYASLSIKKFRPITEKIVTRKIFAITDSMLCQEFNSDNMTNLPTILQHISWEK